MVVMSVAWVLAGFYLILPLIVLLVVFMVLVYWWCYWWCSWLLIIERTPKHNYYNSVPSKLCLLANYCNTLQELNFFIISTTWWSVLQHCTQRSCNNASHCLTLIVNQTLLGHLNYCQYLHVCSCLYIIMSLKMPLLPIVSWLLSAIPLSLYWLGPYSL